MATVNHGVRPSYSSLPFTLFIPLHMSCLNVFFKLLKSQKFQAKIQLKMFWKFSRNFSTSLQSYEQTEATEAEQGTYLILLH